MYLDLNDGEINNLAAMKWSDLPEKWRVDVEPFLLRVNEEVSQNVDLDALWDFAPVSLRVRLLSALAKKSTLSNELSAKSAPK